MKRKFLLSQMAVVAAALLSSLAANGQIRPTKPAPVDSDQPNYKYEIFGGYAYTSLNQVNLSRYGLQGARASITRDWGRYFGLTADGAYYRYPLGSGNPGNPTVETVLFGPVLHAELYGKYSGFVHVLIGGEHSGGESQNPNISFAGGFGGGVEYKLSPRLALRTGGDDIGASFTLTGASPTNGFSPHMTWNPQAYFGAVYRF